MSFFASIHNQLVTSALLLCRQASEQAAGEAKQDYEKELTQLRAQYEERQCLLLSELRKKQRQSGGDAVTCSPQDVAASNKLQVCVTSLR